VAALFDTTVAVLLFRKHPPEEARDLVQAAEREIRGGGALLPAVAATELMIGESTPAGVARLEKALARIPTVPLTPEAARNAGSMGSFLRRAGAPVPLPDLLVAATALWLDVPLLAWDEDYPRSIRIAEESEADHPGAQLWRSLALLPASRRRAD
jgi:predicted nucleic acid-binding protein